VLRAVGQGDLLDLSALCAHRVRHEALIVDLSELFLGALAEVAFQGFQQPPGDELGAWLDVHVERALRKALEADVRDEMQCRPLRATDEARRSFLANLLGMESALARLACVHFNALPRAERRTFWALANRNPKRPPEGTAGGLRRGGVESLRLAAGGGAAARVPEA
jgi:hypothetical protein